MADRDKKRRTLHGDQVKGALLSNAQASQLKIMVRDGASVKVAALRFMIPEATAMAIAAGRSFKYVEPLGNVLPGKYEAVTWKVAERIRWRRDQRLTVRAIALAEGVKRGTVFDVLKHERQKHAAPLTIDQAERLHRLVLKHGLTAVSNKTKLCRKTVLAQSARVISNTETRSEATPAVQTSDAIPEQPCQQVGRDLQEMRGAVEPSGEQAGS